jgi:hypothetical protein
MMKLINAMNKKAAEMDQGTFNVWCGTILSIVVIVPLFIIGLNRWLEAGVQ